MRGFLQVSSRSHYGLRLMTQIANANGEFISLHTIARRENLSFGYLEELAGQLRRHRLIVAARGARGGYKLAKPSEKISISDIVAALEGHTKTLACVGNNSNYRCPMQLRCPSKFVWQKLNDQINKTLSSMTLVDLGGAKLKAK
ncbi:MAG: Iron-sulfur cluster assembly transcription factor IscR [Parcubacteria group bacterium GW2011_GWA2_46_9]|nr:MAG: Iron-sulfur cluster assembly transcription factor IscR [Parcubacteria group bacterium GW2011_GWA2_46_9]